MPVIISDLSLAVPAALRRLSRSRVLVGVPQANNVRVPEPGEEKTPLGNAAIAYIQTNGAPETNLPARPFLAPGIERAKDAIKTALQGAVAAALKGEWDKVEANLDLAGFKAENSAKLVIVEGIPPPLKPATVAARARKNAPKTGRQATAKEQAEFNAFYDFYASSGLASMTGSPTTPLLDTGQLLKSITHIVEVK